MAFVIKPAKKCPKCGADMEQWAHETGPKRMSDPRNWYYQCVTCEHKIEKWVDLMTGGD